MDSKVRQVSIKNRMLVFNGINIKLNIDNENTETITFYNSKNIVLATHTIGLLTLFDDAYTSRQQSLIINFINNHVIVNRGLNWAHVLRYIRVKQASGISLFYDNIYFKKLVK